MCSPLAGNIWSTPVLVHKGLLHGVMTSLPWDTGLQIQQSCTIALAHSVGYKWRSYQDSSAEGLISYMWIQSDSDLTSLINFQGVCVTRLMCSPLAGNFWSTPFSVHKGLIHGVMTSLPWETGLQIWQSYTIALTHSVWLHITVMLIWTGNLLLYGMLGITEIRALPGYLQNFKINLNILMIWHSVTPSSSQFEHSI